MKKLLSFVLAACMLFSLGIAAFAEDEEKAEFSFDREFTGKGDVVISFGVESVFLSDALGLPALNASAVAAAAEAFEYTCFTCGVEYDVLTTESSVFYTLPDEPFLLTFPVKMNPGRYEDISLLVIGQCKEDKVLADIGIWAGEVDPDTVDTDPDRVFSVTLDGCFEVLSIGRSDLPSFTAEDDETVKFTLQSFHACDDLELEDDDILICVSCFSVEGNYAGSLVAAKAEGKPVSGNGSKSKTGNGGKSASSGSAGTGTSTSSSDPASSQSDSSQEDNSISIPWNLRKKKNNSILSGLTGNTGSSNTNSTGIRVTGANGTAEIGTKGITVTPGSQGSSGSTGNSGSSGNTGSSGTSDSSKTGVELFSGKWSVKIPGLGG